MNEFNPKSQSIMQEEEKSKAKRFCKFITFALLIVVVVVLIVIGLIQLDEIYDFDLKKSIKSIFDLMRSVHEEKPYHFILFVFIFLLLNTLLVLPFFTICSIIFAYILKNFWISTAVLALTPVSITFLMYFFVGKCCLGYLMNKLSSVPAYQVLRNNYDTNPFVLCMIIRLLYIPLGSKEYIIIVLGYPFYAVFFSSVIYFTLHAVLFSMIGSHLKSISEAIHKKSWSSMSGEERVEFVSFISLIAMTIFIFVYLNFWLNHQMKQQKAYKDYKRFLYNSAPQIPIKDEETSNFISKSLF